jgi:hypothetical protein
MTRVIHDWVVARRGSRRIPGCRQPVTDWIVVVSRRRYAPLTGRKRCPRRVAVDARSSVTNWLRRRLSRHLRRTLCVLARHIRARHLPLSLSRHVRVRHIRTIRIGLRQTSANSERRGPEGTRHRRSCCNLVQLHVNSLSSRFGCHAGSRTALTRCSVGPQPLDWLQGDPPRPFTPTVRDENTFVQIYWQQSLRHSACDSRLRRSNGLTSDIRRPPQPSRLCILKAPALARRCRRRRSSA